MQYFSKFAEIISSLSNPVPKCVAVSYLFLFISRLVNAFS
jgi:hypothetical protein